jgi:pimeloyl-ACP methyl ester carboxylesterase
MVHGWAANRFLILLAGLGLGLLVLAGPGTASWPNLTTFIIGRKPKPPAPPVADPVQTQFVQVHPNYKDDRVLQRSPRQIRAVVLIHGLHVHPFRNEIAAHATFSGWQLPGSTLVETLKKEADVFAFAYSQNVAIDEIAGVPLLAESIRRLRLLGYAELVLIGHSAGGLVARQFVEDYPDAAITKVIQVCAPNHGAGMAQFEPGVRKNQRPFLHSLSKEGRAEALKIRAGKRIPSNLPFVSVAGDGTGLGDGVVSRESQWPPDLQAQGIPVYRWRTMHFTVMRSQSEANRLAEVVRTPQPRWTPAQVAQMKKELGFK